MEPTPLPTIPTVFVRRPRADKILGPFYVELPPHAEPFNNGVNARLGYNYSMEDSNNRVWIEAWMDGQKTNGYTTYGNFDGQVTAGTGWQNADKYVSVGSAWVRVCDARSAYVGLNAAGAASPWVAAGGYVPGTSDWGSYVEVSTTLYFDQARPPAQMAPPVITEVALTTCRATWVKPSSPVTIGHYLLRRFSSLADYNSTVNYTDYQYNGADTLTGVPTGLTPGKQYWWAMYAAGDGYSAKSGSTSSTQLDTLPNKPDIPSRVSATSTTLVIAYADPVNNGSPLLERRLQLSRDDFATILDTKNSASTPQTFSGLTRGTQYKVRYSVRNSAGWSEYSDALATNTLAAPPAAPINYQATDITSTTAWSTMPTISDNGGAPLTDLKIEYDDTIGPDPIKTVVVGAYAPPFMNDMLPGTPMQYRMAVANSAEGGGWSPWGIYTTFNTKNNVPLPPQNLAISNIAETQARATWLAPADLLGSINISYVLRISKDKSMTQIVQTHTMPPTQLLKDLEGLDPATNYFAQIHTNSSNGLGSASNQVPFATTGTPVGTGLSEWKRINGVWKHGTPWKKISGTWRSGKRWKKINGVWKSGV